MTDEELMHAGDFTTLIERYRESLAAYCAAAVRDTATGDDLAQAVFLAIVDRRDEFKPGRLFRPWLYAIADATTKKHRRRQKRERQKFSDYVASGAATV